MRNAPSSRAAPIASASLRRQRSSSFTSGRYVTMEICSEEGSKGRRWGGCARILGQSGVRVNPSKFFPPRGFVPPAHPVSGPVSSTASPPAAGAAAPSRYPADALVAFGDALLRKSGMRDDMARDVASVLVDGDLLGHTTHGLALLAAVSRRNRERHDGQGRRARRGQCATRRADLGRQPAARTVAHAARARRRDGDGENVRHRHRRHSPLASHRVPRGVPAARDRPGHDGAHLLFRSVDEERRAVRRRVAGVHAQSVRRGHSDAAATRSCSTFPRATRPTA